MNSRNPKNDPLIEVRASALIAHKGNDTDQDSYLVVKERNSSKIDRGKMGISEFWKTPGGRCHTVPGNNPVDHTSLDGLLRELTEEGFEPIKDTFTPAGVYFAEGAGGVRTRALHFYQGNLRSYPSIAAQVNKKASNPTGANTIAEIKYVKRDEAIRHNTDGRCKDLHAETLRAILETYRWLPSFRMTFKQRDVDRQVTERGDIAIGKLKRRMLLAKRGLHTHTQGTGHSLFETLQVYCSLPLQQKPSDPEGKIFVISDIFMYQEIVSCTSLSTYDKGQYQQHVLHTVSRHLRYRLDTIIESRLVDPYLRRA